MTVPLGCSVCGVPLPDVPPSGIYCPACGHFNGAFSLPGPLIAGIDPMANMMLIPDGAEIDLQDTSKPPEIETDVAHFDAMETGCEVRGRGVHVPCMSARLAVEGFLLRIDDAMNPELWMEVALSDELLLSMLYAIFERLPDEARVQIIMTLGNIK